MNSIEIASAPVLPRRSRRSPVVWLASEVKTLHALYPSASWDEIDRALSRHTRDSIMECASRYGLRRVRDRTVISSDPIVAELVAHRMRRRLSVVSVARTSGIDRSHLDRIEIGLFMPSLRLLRKLAAALGYEIVLRPVQTDSSVTAEQ